MVGTQLKIAILGAVAILGLILAIPSSLTSLILTGFGVIAIVVVLIGSVLR